MPFILPFLPSIYNFKEDKKTNISYSKKIAETELLSIQIVNINKFFYNTTSPYLIFCMKIYRILNKIRYYTLRKIHIYLLKIKKFISLLTQTQNY